MRQPTGTTVPRKKPGRVLGFVRALLETLLVVAAGLALMALAIAGVREVFFSGVAAAADGDPGVAAVLMMAAYAVPPVYVTFRIFRDSRRAAAPGGTDDECDSTARRRWSLLGRWLPAAVLALPAFFTMPGTHDSGLERDEITEYLGSSAMADAVMDAIAAGVLSLIAWLGLWALALIYLRAASRRRLITLALLVVGMTAYWLVAGGIVLRAIPGAS